MARSPSIDRMKMSEALAGVGVLLIEAVTECVRLNSGLKSRFRFIKLLYVGIGFAHRHLCVESVMVLVRVSPLYTLPISVGDGDAGRRDVAIERCVTARQDPQR